jgi:uncharacterized coiled-coil DUF342 family protein
MTDVTAEIKATAGDKSAMNTLVARYQRLCTLRDEANAKIDKAGLRAKLDAANERAEVARREASQYAAQIQEIRGGGVAWLSLKREIGQLADTVMRLRKAGAK